QPPSTSSTRGAGSKDPPLPAQLSTTALAVVGSGARRMPRLRSRSPSSFAFKLAADMLVGVPAITLPDLPGRTATVTAGLRPSGNQEGGDDVIQRGRGSNRESGLGAAAVPDGPLARPRSNRCARPVH